LLRCKVVALAAQGQKDAALLRPFRGQVSQRGIGLGPRSSVQVPRQNFGRKSKFTRKNKGSPAWRASLVVGSLAARR
jgi:hypothetical protein